MSGRRLSDRRELADLTRSSLPRRLRAWRASTGETVLLLPTVSRYREDRRIGRVSHAGVMTTAMTVAPPRRRTSNLRSHAAWFRVPRRPSRHARSVARAVPLMRVGARRRPSRTTARPPACDSSSPRAATRRKTCPWSKEKNRAEPSFRRSKPWKPRPRRSRTGRSETRSRCRRREPHCWSRGCGRAKERIAALRPRRHRANRRESTKNSRKQKSTPKSLDS